MHRNMWGDFHCVITGKDANGNVTYEGGWQNNRRTGMHDKYRFVENIFEERGYELRGESPHRVREKVAAIRPSIWLAPEAYWAGA
jgi:hypothetical protein